MGRDDYHPMNKSEMARALEIPSYERAAMRATLNKLERKGKIVCGKKSRYRLEGEDPGSNVHRENKRGSEGGLMVGVIKFQQSSGHAWFYPDLDNKDNILAGLNPEKFDRVFVQSYNTGLALDGDRVSVRVKLPSKANGGEVKDKAKRGKFRGKTKGPKFSGFSKKKRRFDDEAKGKVLRVIERESGIVLGTYRERGKFRYIEPDFAGFDRNMDLTGGVSGAKSGQRVVVELVRWDSKSEAPLGKITKVLGWPEDPGVDIESVISKHNLRAGFSSEVKDEAVSLLASLQSRSTGDVNSDDGGDPVIEISSKELDRREDWREELVLTVDPDDAKDFDDALAVKQLESGGFELAVHIADVSHYIKPGSGLDEEARKRGNSTYLVDRVLPMLPFQISNNICSLRPEVDRLTKCAVITFDKNGHRLSARFCDAVIHSKIRLAYEQAQLLLGLPLENSTEVELPNVSEEVIKALKLTWKLASILRKKRFADGALDLEFEETKIVLDDKLKAVDVVDVVHNESHQMVEECMLAANEARRSRF